MRTSLNDIRMWLKEGIAQGATHCIVCCDTFGYEDYPRFVKPGEDPRAYEPGDMQRIMEVYALHLDIEMQLAERQAFHWDMPPAKVAATAPATTRAKAPKSPTKSQSLAPVDTIPTGVPMKKYEYRLIGGCVENAAVRREREDEINEFAKQGFMLVHMCCDADTERPFLYCAMQREVRDTPNDDGDGPACT